MELLAPSFRKTYKVQESNKKYALKEFLVSCDVCVIFTAVKHKDILSEKSFGKFPVKQKYKIEL